MFWRISEQKNSSEISPLKLKVSVFRFHIYRRPKVALIRIRTVKPNIMKIIPLIIPSILKDGFSIPNSNYYGLWIWNFFVVYRHVTLHLLCCFKSSMQWLQIKLILPANYIIQKPNMSVRVDILRREGTCDFERGQSCRTCWKPDWISQ